MATSLHNDNAGGAAAAAPLLHYPFTHTQSHLLYHAHQYPHWSRYAHHANASASGSGSVLATTPAREPSKAAKQVAELCAGASAGAITKTAVAPLERVKILFQIQANHLRVNRDGVPKYHGIAQTLRLVVKEEGIVGWYKGNLANVVRVVPVYSLKFALNDEFKRMLRSEPNEKLPIWKLLIAGNMAGISQQLCTYPLELIRTRLAMSADMGTQYKGMVDCAVTTFRVEGFRALYKGLGPTLVSGAPYVGIQMSFFEVFKRLASDAIGGGEPSMLLKLVLGASAGVTAQTITYPGDVVRRRMQTDGINGKARIYRHAWHCVTHTVKNEGFRGLYIGLGVNTVRAIPGAALQFAAYDTLKPLFTSFVQ